MYDLIRTDIETGKSEICRRVNWNEEEVKRWCRRMNIMFERNKMDTMFMSYRSVVDQIPRFG